MNKIVALALSLAAWLSEPVQAEGMYKCTDSRGVTAYQEAPCARGASQSVKAKPNAGEDKAANGFVTAGEKAFAKDAYASRMARGDYSGAMAFATTEQEKDKARQAMAKKDAKCAELKIRRDEAYANSRSQGQAKQHAAEAAQARVTAAGC